MSNFDDDPRPDLSAPAAGPAADGWGRTGWDVAELLRGRVAEDVEQALRDKVQARSADRSRAYADEPAGRAPEVGALIAARFGPAVLADTVNAAVRTLAASFPICLALAPLVLTPGVEAAVAHLPSQEWAVAWDLFEAAWAQVDRARAADPPVAHADDDTGAPSGGARPDRGALDGPCGGELDEADVVVVLGERCVDEQGQLGVFLALFALFAARVSQLRRVAGDPRR